MKRELAFALSSYSQLTGSLGRTRSSKPRDFDDVSVVQESTAKRRKSRKRTGLDFEGETDGPIDQNSRKKNGILAATGSGKPNSNGELSEAKIVVDDATKCMAKVPGESTHSPLVPQTEVVQLNCLDQVSASASGASNIAENQTGPVVEMNESTELSVLTPTKKMEMKMSKKIGLGKVPRTVKELFDTGLLEGYPVFYNGGTQEPPVRGLIKDVGILCMCSSCMGSKVLNPCEFEIHACSSYRRAAQYICLENGTSLLDVVRACKQSRLDSLEETVRSVVGPLPAKESGLCPSCKGSSVVTIAEKVEGQCKICVSKMDSNARFSPFVSPVRRSSRNASDNISLQDINRGDISSQSINEGGIPSQDIIEDKIAKERFSPFVSPSRRSCRNASDNMSLQDINGANISPQSTSEGDIPSQDVIEDKIAKARSLQSVSPLRRSSRNASNNISSQDINKGNISSQSIIKENISSQDVIEDKIAKDSTPRPSLGLRRRRSGINTTRYLSSPDVGQEKIRKVRSSKSSLVTKTPKSSSGHVSSEGRSELKIGERPPEFFGSISEIVMQETRSRKVTPMSSKSILGSRTPKSSSVSTARLSSQQKGKWKITRKDQRLHRLVFEDGGLPDGTEVAYYSDGQKLLVGYKKGTGIFCNCCETVVTASAFEAHAGRASRRKPYNYIYTSNGVSLHEFAVSLLKTRKCSAKDNDDLCIICADGGDLLLCDGCPRAFHKECASLSSVPSGKWYCQYCQNMFVREKFVECNANAVAAGRVSGVDLIQQITQRCIRIVTTRENEEIVACVLCRGYDFRKSGFGPRTVIVCDQCEKEYHVGCLKEHNMADLEELPEGKWFCCDDCRSIFSDIQSLLNRGGEEIHDSLLTVIKQKHKEKGSDTITHFEVKWTVLNGKVASPENRPLLSQAVSILHETFSPIVDAATGKDYIPAMVYGRNLKGQDFSGMYCAVLTVNSSVVSVGLFRVFGQKIAELPLVATSNCHQGKGYFQLLFSCIEKLLACLNVKNLVLPAAPVAESIWTDKFGFEKIDPETLSEYRKTCWPLLTFQGTCMLQKSVPNLSTINQNVIDAELE